MFKVPEKLQGRKIDNLIMATKINVFSINNKKRVSNAKIKSLKATNTKLIN